MPDDYIDNSETQVYGPFAEASIAVLGDLDPIITRLVAGMHEVDGAMYEALRAATTADGNIALAVDAKGPIGLECVTTMNAFHDLLKGWTAAAMLRAPLTEFFADGTKASGGSTPALRIVGLARIIDATTRYDVPGREAWVTRFTDLRTRLTEAVAASNAARRDRKPATEQLAQARDRWLRQYRATKLIVEGLLVLAGREAEYRSFFKDLQVGTPSTGSTTTDPTTGTTDAPA